MRLAQSLRHPGAYLPLVLSGAALLVVLVHVALRGTAPEADEGAAAHLWQLLIALQAPVMLWWGLRGLREDARSTLRVLLLQLLGICVAAAPVLALGL